MPSGEFNRYVDVSVVISLASLLVVLSAIIFLLDRNGQNRSRRDPGTFALLCAHVWYLIASLGLELGKTAPFAVSASMVIAGALFGVVSGYVGMRANLLRQRPEWRWLIICAGIALAEAALVFETGNLAALFVSSSLINGSLSLYFAWDLRNRARRAGFLSTWLVALPFGAISAGYVARLALVAFGPPHVVVVASIGIGLTFPVAAIFWVFGSMALRSFYLARELEVTATRDALTGLGNRAALDRLKARLPGAERRREGRYSACLCIDLDLFKEVNDTYGHEGGDAVLVAIADRLRRHARPNDKVFRIGGDEFVFWRECDATDDLVRFLEDLLADLCAPIRHGEIDLIVGASIGVEVSNRDAAPWDLIRRADIALYKSKEFGRSRVTRFTRALGSAYDARLTALSEFRTAVEAGQLTAYFQPQVNVTSGALTGCEVLARWNHPARGVLGPAEFLPLAEELGMLDAVDRRILDLAVAAQGYWHDTGTPVPRISVNVSTGRLCDASLVAEIEARREFLHSKLSFEVLETIFVEKDQILLWNVDRLRDLDVGIEVDDFGTGHASLSAVLALKPDRIKIDRCFVQGVDLDRGKREILRTLIELCARAEAASVIEGVETRAQISILRDLGATEIQGYAIAAPMDRDAMTAWLRSLGTAGWPAGMRSAG